MNLFSGLIPPMVTPLDAKRRLDKAGVKKMVRHLVFGGVDGIFLLGTTGEGPHLSYAIRRELVKETCRLVKGQVPVLVGITETDLEDALAFARDCKTFGASAVVAAPPYYFKLTQAECLAWFTEMADRSPLPVIVYDMPAHTDTVIEPATIAKLAAHGNIVAMKDSSSVIALFNKFRLALEPFKDKFSLFMGPDEAMGEAVLLGADGVVAAPPYYFKLTQAECVAWFTELADRSPLPLVVYDMPAHTDTVIDPATIVTLAAHRNIVAMKDSSSVIALFNKFRLALEPFKDRFALFMGPDEAMGEAVALGADGGVCTGANLWPAAFKAMYLAAKSGDLDRVRQLQRFTTMSSYLLYGLGSGQIGFLKGVKAALAEMGLVRNVLAAPFAPFAGKELQAVRKALKTLRREYAHLSL